MNILLGLISIVFGAFLVRFREATANSFGEPDWAAKVGGMQIVVVIIGILFCLWGLAMMTSTTDLLLWPLAGLFRRSPASGL